MLIKVDLNAISHNFSAKEVIHLEQETSAFAVADFVIGIDSIMCMIDCHLNRMRCRPSVFIQSLCQEMESNLLSIFDVTKLLTLGETDAGRVLCKAFLEPQVIPPSHCHQVSKPHVRQLMDRDLVPHLEFEEGLLVIRSHEGVSHHNAPRVLHA